MGPWCLRRRKNVALDQIWYKVQAIALLFTIADGLAIFWLYAICIWWLREGLLLIVLLTGRYLWWQTNIPRRYALLVELGLSGSCLFTFPVSVLVIGTVLLVCGTIVNYNTIWWRCIVGRGRNVAVAVGLSLDHWYVMIKTTGRRGLPLAVLFGRL